MSIKGWMTLGTWSVMSKSYDQNIEKAKKFIFMSLVLSLFAHFVVFSVTMIERQDHKVAQATLKKHGQKIKVFLRKKFKAKQIVTSEESEIKKRAKKAKFLGKTTQTFIRETSARNVGSFKKAGQGARHGAKGLTVSRAKIPEKIVKPSKLKAPKQKIASKKFHKKSRFKKKVSFSDLAATKIRHRRVSKRRPVVASLAALGLRNGALGASGLSANNDFVEDIPLGDMTRLNTVEDKYYGFYYRIKQRLEQYWGDSIQKKAAKLWKSGRRMPASQNRITSLEVTIDHTGKVVAINIKGSSGIRELDEAAIESFNHAGPFPNPPKGMVKNGQARIQWGFVVKG